MAREIRGLGELGRAISELEVDYDRFIAPPGHIPRKFPTEEVDLSSPLTSHRDGEEPKLVLHNAIISSPMQAVYSPELNIELAKLGAFCISNYSQAIENQASQRRYVRNRKAGFVTPEVVNPEMLIGDLFRLSEERGYSTFPVTEDSTLKTPMIGIITANDYDPEEHGSLRVKDRMIPRDKIIFYYHDEIGNDLEKADRILKNSHHGSIPLLDRRNDTIVYMVFRKDVDEHRKNPNALVDEEKRYIGGDAINTHDYRERVPALVEAGSKFLYVWSSVADSDHVIDTMNYIQQNFPDIIVGAGNVVTKEGFWSLAENGAECIGVGMGPASICKTQEQIGVGRPQATAIIEVAKARDDYYRETGTYVIIIGDGGFEKPRDFVIGYSLDADAIMGGKVFAGTSESPTEVDYKRNPPAKPYWGEGSNRAREWMEKRYGQNVFEEGVDDWVEFVGPVRPYMEKFIYTIKDGIRKGGCRSIMDAHENMFLDVISEAASREGRPHDLISYK